LVANCRDQARVLRAAGADLFALEMLFDVDTSLAMLQAVSEFDVPVIVGFTCGWSERGDRQVTTRPGLGLQPQPLAEVLAGVIEASDAQNMILSIMHSDADVTDAALQLLRRHWDGPVAIYPNSGHFVDLHLQFDSVCSADDFARAADGWLAQGVQIVGGCCGIGPSHIRRLSGKLDYS